MKSDLPNSSQFSPVQTPLPVLLRVVREHQPNRSNVTDGIAQHFFAGRVDAQKLANNTVLALSEYGLLNKPTDDQTIAHLTELGQTLAETAEQGKIDDLYADFARHILLYLHGLDLLTCADDIAATGQQPTKALIVKEMRIRGIYHPPNGTHANGMRQWLEQAGLVEKDKWIAKPGRLRALLGTVDAGDIDQFATLTPEQRAFAKAFARLNVDEMLSNKVAAYASTLFGVEFPEGGLPQSTLFALRDVGLIECEKTTSGQGAKPYIVRSTDRLKNEMLEPIFSAIEHSIGIQYRTLIRMRYADILDGLNSDSKHQKGLALESLAFYLGRMLNLSFVQWRLRSNQTGGAELDVVMEGTNLIFSRWQIQCKNASEASLDDIAKEVGIAQVIKANVILIVTTGRIGRAARQFAEQVMRETNLYVGTLDRNDLQRIRHQPTDIVEILNTQADGAMKLKRSQINPETPIIGLGAKNQTTTSRE